MANKNIKDTFYGGSNQIARLPYKTIDALQQIGLYICFVYSNFLSFQVIKRKSALSKLQNYTLSFTPPHFFSKISVRRSAKAPKPLLATALRHKKSSDTRATIARRYPMQKYKIMKQSRKSLFIIVATDAVALNCRSLVSPCWHACAQARRGLSCADG